MKPTRAIFISRPDQDLRFEQDHDWLCENLKDICNKWGDYIEQYLKSTNDLFGVPEIPWHANERVLVSNLAASIIRMNDKNIISEELRLLQNVKAERNFNAMGGSKKVR